MAESDPRRPDRSPAARPVARPDPGARYRVELLPWAEIGPDGVTFADGPRRARLPFTAVLHARAAEVGEPEGVRTVVFDLVVERKDAECTVRRFDADPGEAAQAAARTLVDALGPQRCARSLLDLATEAVPSLSFRDLDALAEDALAALGL